MEVDLSKINEPLTATTFNSTSECNDANPKDDRIMDTGEPVLTDCDDNGPEEKSCTDCEIISDSDTRKSTENPIPTANIYCPPNWALNCPPNLDYKLEVIKNGLQLSECTVNLSSKTCETNDEASVYDNNGLSFCLIGRQPQPNYAPFNDIIGQCMVLAHPSISRLHAVLQYGKPPHSIGHVPEDEKDTTGWYLQDLESTHGTFVNKRRLPSGRYVRIRVGYVLRFGGSTRLHIFQGPDEDTEQQTAQSWFDLKKSYEERKMMAVTEKKDTLSSKNSQSVKLECDWGISLEDPIPEPIPSLLQSGSCLSYEKLYRDDPKRALNAYFEREGIDPVPQYEFVEAPFGKQHCRIELPLSSGTVTAEAVVSGKRKEAVVACALEACQLLDRLGEFDPDKDRSTSSKCVRSRAYWEENDYYSSDEDTFIDRTGIVEKKRLDRMRQLGVDDGVQSEAKQNESKRQANEKRINQDSTMLSMLSELEKIGEEIVSIEEELEAIDREFSSKESNPSQLDELEAYMNALKTSSSDRVKRSKLKARLISLRQTELQLMHRAGLTQFRRNLKKNNGQANTSEYISSSEAAAAVRAAKNKLNNNNLNSEEDQNTATSEQKIKNIRADRNALKRSLQSHARSLYVSQKKIEVDKPFEVENDDEDDNEEEEVDQNEEKQIDTGPKSQPESYDLLLTKSDSKINECSNPVTESPLISAGKSTDNPLDFSKNENMTVNNDEAVVKPSKVIRENKLSGTGKHHIRIMGPTLPHPQSQKPINPDVSRKTKLLMEADPDYVEWVPPPDQHGDGVTPLNAKYGY